MDFIIQYTFSFIFFGAFLVHCMQTCLKEDIRRQFLNLSTYLSENAREHRLKYQKKKDRKRTERMIRIYFESFYSIHCSPQGRNKFYVKNLFYIVFAGFLIFACELIAMKNSVSTYASDDGRTFFFLFFTKQSSKIRDNLSLFY